MSKYNFIGLNKPEIEDLLPQWTRLFDSNTSQLVLVNVIDTFLIFKKKIGQLSRLTPTFHEWGNWSQEKGNYFLGIIQLAVKIRPEPR